MGGNQAIGRHPCVVNSISSSSYGLGMIIVELYVVRQVVRRQAPAVAAPAAVGAVAAFAAVAATIAKRGAAGGASMVRRKHPAHAPARV